MRKMRSFVLFTTVVLGLSALSFVSVTEAQHRPEARDRPPAPVTLSQPAAPTPDKTQPSPVQQELNKKLLVNREASPD